MKKILFGSIALMALSVSLTANADILPLGKKYIPACAIIENTASFPDLKFFTVENGDFDETQSWVTEIDNTDCVTRSYSRFGDFDLYAVNKNDIPTSGSSSYNPSTDPKAYKANIELDINSELTDESDPIEYIHRKYEILKLDTVTKHIVITLKSKETNLGTTSGVLPHPEFPFTDVQTGSTYFDALTYLKAEGIVSGYADGSFQPNKTLNRAEFTKIVVESIAEENDIGECTYLFIHRNGHSNIFSDVKATSKEWYVPYVCYAKMKNMVSGYTDGSFKSDQTINFAEAAKIIIEAYNVVTSDANQPWYKKYVEDLETKKAIPESISSFNKMISRGEMAEIIYRLKANNTNLPSKTYDQLN